ncbi:MAG: hypothetical protein QW835_00090 [Candidatus Hadarchaeum sp.]
MKDKALLCGNNGNVVALAEESSLAREIVVTPKEEFILKEIVGGLDCSLTVNFKRAVSFDIVLNFHVIVSLKFLVGVGDVKGLRKVIGTLQELYRKFAANDRKLKIIASTFTDQLVLRKEEFGWLLRVFSDFNEERYLAAMPSSKEFLELCDAHFEKASWSDGLVCRLDIGKPCRAPCFISKEPYLRFSQFSILAENFRLQMECAKQRVKRRSIYPLLAGFSEDFPKAVMEALKKLGETRDETRKETAWRSTLKE